MAFLAGGVSLRVTNGRGCKVARAKLTDTQQDVCTDTVKARMFNFYNDTPQVTTHACTHIMKLTSIKH
eukprot:1315276-Amphidinium_carterae.4